MSPDSAVPHADIPGAEVLGPAEIARALTRVAHEILERNKGADGVLISGCHIGDCHYIDANHWTEKRVARIHKKMEKIGLRPERLQLEWISAAEGILFAETMKKMEALRRSVSTEEIAETQNILSKL